MKKAFLILIPILFVLAILFFLSSFLIPDALPLDFVTIATVLWLVIVVWNLIVIYLNGTLRKSQMMRLIFISFACLIIGALFKLQHWQGATYIYCAGTVLFVSAYWVHFYKKKGRTLLDLAKLLYVLSFAVSVAFTVFQLPYKVEVGSMGPFFTGLLTYVLFYFKYYNEKDELKATIANEGNSVFKETY